MSYFKTAKDTVFKIKSKGRTKKIVGKRKGSKRNGQEKDILIFPYHAW